MASREGRAGIEWLNGLGNVSPESNYCFSKRSLEVPVPLDHRLGHGHHSSFGDSTKWLSICNNGSVRANLLLINFFVMSLRWC